MIYFTQQPDGHRVQITCPETIATLKASPKWVCIVKSGMMEVYRHAGEKSKAEPRLMYGGGRRLREPYDYIA